MDQRELILIEAKRLFAAGGEAAVSVREIASRINCQSSLVNYHFKSRELLIEAVIKSANAACLDVLYPLFRDLIPKSAAELSGGADAHALLSKVINDAYDGMSTVQDDARIIGWHAMALIGTSSMLQSNLHMLLQPFFEAYMPVIRSATGNPDIVSGEVMSFVMGAILIPILLDGSPTEAGGAISGKNILSIGLPTRHAGLDPEDS